MPNLREVANCRGIVGKDIPGCLIFWLKLIKAGDLFRLLVCKNSAAELFEVSSVL